MVPGAPRSPAADKFLDSTKNLYTVGLQQNCYTGTATTGETIPKIAHMSPLSFCITTRLLF